MTVSITQAVRTFLVTVLAGLTACAVMVAVAGDATAQTPSTKPAAKKAKAAKPKAKSDTPSKSDPAEAQKALEAGIRAHQAGKNEAALEQFDKAIAGGSLPPNLLARALYYRGIVYRKTNKPVLAISDLTSSLWIKGGLGDQERAEALTQRAQAYREAGLPEPAPGGETGATARSSPKDATRVASAAETGVAPSAAPSSSGIGGFFSNLFSGSDSPPPASALTHESSPDAARDNSARPAAPPAKSVGTSWSSNTEVETRKTGTPEKKAAAAPERKIAARPPAKAASPDLTTGSLAARSLPGGIRLHVATLPTRQAAEAVVQRIKREHGAALASREPAVDEMTSSGARAFAVRIGPFANAEQSRELCAGLRKSGLECSIVAR